jgi:hypothetical protein
MNIRVFMLLFIGLMGSSTFMTAQTKTIPFDPDVKKIKFQEVINETGTQAELFKRCVYWLNDYYKDPVRVTIVRDEPTGKIMGKHNIRLKNIDKDSVVTDGPTVFYEFTIEVRDERFRYTITELLLKSASRFEIERWLDKNDPLYNEQYASYLDQIAVFVEEWATVLKEKMKPEPTIKVDSW